MDAVSGIVASDEGGDTVDVVVSDGVSMNVDDDAGLAVGVGMGNGASALTASGWADDELKRRCRRG